jgi:transposase
MEGFVVHSQTEEDGELWVLVETTADVAGCPSCGVRATGHGRSVLQVRDLPAGGRPVRLCWRKRRWICLDPECPAKSFTEQSPGIEGCVTRRAATEICSWTVLPPLVRTAASSIDGIPRIRANGGVPSLLPAQTFTTLPASSFGPPIPDRAERPSAAVLRTKV